MSRTFKKLGWQVVRGGTAGEWWVYDHDHRSIGAFKCDKGQAVVAALTVETEAGRIEFTKGRWDHVRHNG